MLPLLMLADAAHAIIAHDAASPITAAHAITAHDAASPTTLAIGAHSSCASTDAGRSAVPPALRAVSTQLERAVRVRPAVASAARSTSHAKGREALHFLVLSDWGGLPVWPWTTPAQKGVAAAMGRLAATKRSKFALSLGDHFYFSGVRNVHDPRFRRTFERVFDAPSLAGPGFFRMAAGNHDHDGNISAQLAYAARRRSRWYYPALQHSWRERLPGEEGGTVAFVLIDTVMLCGMPKRRPPLTSELHWAWLQKALAAADDADYLIVGGHYPVHSPASHGPNYCLRRRLLPLLNKHKASVYFSGHDHAMFHVGSDGVAGVQFHGVGAGFTTTASRRHLHTCRRQLRFHHRGGRRPLHALSGGFAGVSINASHMVVSHYDATGQFLYAHATPPRRQAEAVDLPSDTAQGGL